MTAGSAATAGAFGMRAWLATRRWTWMTPRCLRVTSGLLLAAGVLGAGVLG